MQYMQVYGIQIHDCSILMSGICEAKTRLYCQCSQDLTSVLHLRASRTAPRRQSHCLFQAQSFKFPSCVCFCTSIPHYRSIVQSVTLSAADRTDTLPPSSCQSRLMTEYSLHWIFYKESNIFPFFFKKNYFVFSYMNICWGMCIRVQEPMATKRRHWIPKSWSHRCGEPWCGFWALNSG